MGRPAAKRRAPVMTIAVKLLLLELQQDVVVLMEEVRLGRQTLAVVMERLGVVEPVMPVPVQVVADE